MAGTWFPLYRAHQLFAATGGMVRPAHQPAPNARILVLRAHRSWSADRTVMTCTHRYDVRKMMRRAARITALGRLAA
jgi:hypothetical protein